MTQHRTPDKWSNRIGWAAVVLVAVAVAVVLGVLDAHGWF